jgi:hypothetical protein
MPPRHYRLLIGIDEAGYGPNLGPLVIGCSAWLVESQANDIAMAASELETLLDRLRPVFQGKPVRGSSTHIPLGDSKAIHSKEGPVDSLWTGVQFWLNRIGSDPINDRELVQTLAPDFLREKKKEQPWYSLMKSLAPVAKLKSTGQSESNSSISRRNSAGSQHVRVLGFSEETKRNAEHLIDELKLLLVGLSARIVDESSFNRGVEKFGNKAGLLSFESLSLALRSIENFSSQKLHTLDGRLLSIHVYCDKHGGRNRYHAPLLQVMPNLWFQAERESPLRSDYHSKWNESIPLYWSFIAKGDRLLGSALASMIAKLLREKMMDRFNAFWKSHLPDIEPTAGYPVDAIRFRNEIASKANELRLPEQIWWRCR